MMAMAAPNLHEAEGAPDTIANKTAAVISYGCARRC
jgi:hypothetical protein